VLYIHDQRFDTRCNLPVAVGRAARTELPPLRGNALILALALSLSLSDATESSQSPAKRNRSQRYRAEVTRGEPDSDFTRYSTKQHSWLCQG
jgi:hypothetical protein